MKIENWIELFDYTIYGGAAQAWGAKSYQQFRIRTNKSSACNELTLLPNNTKSEMGPITPILGPRCYPLYF